MEAVSFEIGGKKVSIETGHVAKQANGAVLIRCEETVVLASICAEEDSKVGATFFPLTVNYREKAYASGRVPGGFFKREARPTDKEVLVMRLTDRPLRPLFPKNYRHEVQVMTQVLSFDGSNLPDVLSITATAFALAISDLPVHEYFACVRIVLIDGEYVLNPTVEEIDKASMDMVVAGTSETITMVEGSAFEMSEEEMLKGLEIAQKSISSIIEVQKELVKKCGKKKIEYIEVPEQEKNSELYDKIKKAFLPHVDVAFDIFAKKGRASALEDGKKAVLETLEETDCEGFDVGSVFSSLTKERTRELMVEKNKRVDGRNFNEIRSISSETGLLPRTHGSALFTRGETQVLATITLGSVTDEQMIDGLDGLTRKKFILHYNFPPFSVGECKPMRSVSRREIGHGFLAEKALAIVNADYEGFPYTIRIVAEVLESNGSSSMASVCSGSMALMDAGVPIKAPVAGIAMGLIQQGDGTIVLSDISGTEDHFGDMDFKIAGTEKGITSFQMDIKVSGISFDTLKKALFQAKDGRLFILGEMSKTISEPRKELSKYAPKIVSFTIPVSKIKDVIGPGGKVIKGIIKKTAVDINVEDTGEIVISSPDQKALDEAVSIVQKLTQEPVIGDVYEARVVKIMDFGAFVEFLPGKEGLVHISQIASQRVRSVRDFLTEGDLVKAKLIDIDKMGRKSLSIKAVLEK